MRLTARKMKYFLEVLGQYNMEQCFRYGPTVIRIEDRIPSNNSVSDLTTNIKNETVSYVEFHLVRTGDGFDWELV